MIFKLRLGPSLARSVVVRSSTQIQNIQESYSPNLPDISCSVGCYACANVELDWISCRFLDWLVAKSGVVLARSVPKGAGNVPFSLCLSQDWVFFYRNGTTLPSGQGVPGLGTRHCWMWLSTTPPPSAFCSCLVYAGIIKLEYIINRLPKRCIWHAEVLKITF